MTEDLSKTAEALARNGFFLVFGSAIANIILAVGTIVAGRLLGPEGYGQYSIILIVPQLLFLLTDLGINQGIIKFATKLRVNGESGRIPGMVNCGILIRFIIGFALSVVLYVFADQFAAFALNRVDFSPYLRLMSIVILFQVIYSTAVSAFISLDRAEYSALTTGLDAVVKTSFTIGLILLGLGVSGALIGTIVGYAVAGLCGVVLLRFVLPKKKPLEHQPLKSNVKTLMQYGAPLYVVWMLVGIVPLFQNLILANFTTDINVGNFKAASNFAILMTVLSIPITNALLSAFSRLDSAQDQKVKFFFKRANKYTALIVFPITTLFILFSHEIVQIVYGSTYQYAALYLAAYCLVYFLTGFGYLNLASYYNGIGKTRITLAIGLITFIIIGVLSPVLTLFYGVLGLIAAFLVANLVGTSYGAYTAKKKFGAEFDAKAITKIFFISLGSAIPLLLIQSLALPVHYSLILGSLLYLVTYATLIPIAKTVTGSELDMLNGTLQKVSLLKFAGRIILGYEQMILQIVFPSKRKK